MILFAVEITKVQFPDLEILAHLREIISELPMTKSHKALGNNMTSTFSKQSEKLHTLPAFSPVVEFIEAQSKIYWDALGYYPDVFPKIYQSWSNVGIQHSEMHIHNHCKAPLSAVLYLSKDTNSGNIIFENPMDLIIGGQPIKMPYKNFTHEVNVSTGDLVIFPGYLKHFTAVNHSETPRMVFVANLNAKGY